MVVQLTTDELKKIISEVIKEERPDNTSNTLKEVFGLDEFCEMTGYSKQTAYKLVHERRYRFTSRNTAVVKSFSRERKWKSG